MANKEDGCKGTFWESRYKSVAVLDRLGTSAEVCGGRIWRLFSQNRLLGSYFATARERLGELARKRGMHHLDNLAGAPA